MYNKSAVVGACPGGLGVKEKKVLIFDDKSSAKGLSFDLPADRDFTVYETTRVLDAVHILKTENIGLVISVSAMRPEEKEEFKSVVEMVRPGANVLFVQPGMNGSGAVLLTGLDFNRYLKSTLDTELTLNAQLREFKDFFLAFAERMLQIFGATNSCFYSKDHLVAWLSRRTALKLGLSQEIGDNIQIASLLRDIGMLSIKQQILEERRRFSIQELVPIKKHPQNSVQILKQIKFPWNVDAIILQHHENYDGSGYPGGLRGRDISIGARIVHVADSYVAMTTERPYRQALSADEAKDEIIKGTGTQFDPEITEAFLSVLDGEAVQNGSKYSIVVMERAPELTGLIKLLVDAAKFDVATVPDIEEMLRALMQSMPDLIVADVAVFGKEDLVHFFNAMYEVPSLQNCAFIFVLTDNGYPRHFIGENVRYLSTPIDMGEMSAAIKSFVFKGSEGRPQKPESKGLSGSIDDFTLADIVQILQLGLKTARVEITSGGKTGILYILRGNITHASSGRLKGEEAFFEMMKWEGGSFNIQHGAKSNDVNVTSETMYLLLEALRLLDESKRAASR
jgi:response regulator RpfG family c-di-GMP phosphodiesterase